MADLKWAERPLAFTDLETTGLEKLRADSRGSERLCRWHEICEIGLVLANQKTLEIIDTWSAKMHVDFPCRMSPEALAVNGYNEAVWRKEAIGLRAALAEYSRRAKGAVFVSQIDTFDWTFLEIAFTVWQMPFPIERHKRDFPSYVAGVLEGKGYPQLESYSLRNIAKFLGLSDEPMPHRALNGATQLYKVYKAIRELPPAASL